MGALSAWLWGLGSIWLLWNVVASFDPLLASSPFAANWPLAILLTLSGVALSFIDRFRG